MDNLNMTIPETPLEISKRVQSAVNDLLTLKVENMDVLNPNTQTDLWYCKRVINILIIGEYCNHLPNAVLDEYAINWKELIYPRHFFAHITPKAVQSTVLNYINNVNLRLLYNALSDIIELTEQLSESHKSTITENISKTLLQVIYNCFENTLTKPDSNLPLFDDKLIAQITGLSAKTIRRIRKEYNFQNIKAVGFGDMSTDPY